MRVRIDNVRLAFHNRFEPQSYQGGPPRYNAKFIFAPDSPAANKIKTSILSVIAEKKGTDKAKAVFQKLLNEGGLCLYTKPKTNSEGDVYEGFEGNWYVSASSKSKPKLLARSPRRPDGSLAEIEGDDLYAGCYVNALLDIWMQRDGKRVNASLVAVQFADEGEPFGGGGAPVTGDEFEDLGTPDSEADLESLV